MHVSGQDLLASYTQVRAKRIAPCFSFFAAGVWQNEYVLAAEVHVFNTATEGSTSPRTAGYQVPSEDCHCAKRHPSCKYYLFNLFSLGTHLAMDLPRAVADVLRKAECEHLFTMEGTRIKCTLNGHCIPLESISMLERFVGCASLNLLLLEAVLLAAQLNVCDPGGSAPKCLIKHSPHNT